MVEVVIGILRRGDEILICRRRAADPFGGLWEFPGGKVEAGESAEDCLRRELREELGIDVEPGEGIEPVEFDYPKARIRLIPFFCSIGNQDPEPLASQELRWVKAGSLTEYSFPEANGILISRIRQRLSD